MKSKSPATLGTSESSTCSALSTTPQRSYWRWGLPQSSGFGATPMAPAATVTGSAMQNNGARTALLARRSRAIDRHSRKSRCCGVKEPHCLPKVRHRVVDVLHGIIQSGGGPRYLDHGAAHNVSKCLESLVKVGKQ